MATPTGRRPAADHDHVPPFPVRAAAAVHLRSVHRSMHKVQDRCDRIQYAISLARRMTTRGRHPEEEERLVPVPQAGRLPLAVFESALLHAQELCLRLLGAYPWPEHHGGVEARHQELVRRELAQSTPGRCGSECPRPSSRRSRIAASRSTRPLRSDRKPGAGCQRHLLHRGLQTPGALQFRDRGIAGDKARSRRHVARLAFNCRAPRSPQTARSPAASKSG